MYACEAFCTNTCVYISVNFFIIRKAADMLRTHLNILCSCQLFWFFLTSRYKKDCDIKHRLFCILCFPYTQIRESPVIHSAFSSALHHSKENLRSWSGSHETQFPDNRVYDRLPLQEGMHPVCNDHTVKKSHALQIP